MIELLLQFFPFGALIAAIVTIIGLLFNRRKTAAETAEAAANAAKAENEAALAAANAARAKLDATIAADDHMRQLQTDNITMYNTLDSLRREVDKKIAAAVAEVELKANEKVAVLQQQLDEANKKNHDLESIITQQTLDRAKVEIAERYIAERDGFIEEIAALHEQVKEIPILRREVARLTALATDAETERIAADAAAEAVIRQGDRPHD